MVPRSNSLPTLLEAHQVVQRIVQRAQVRIDFLRQVAGQKAQSFSRFYGGTHQYDALNRIALQRIHGRSHGEIGLAGAGRADAERDVVRLNVLQVLNLAAACGRASRRGA